MSANAFSDVASDRIDELVKWFTRTKGQLGPIQTNPGGGSVEPVICRVTSATVDGNGHYPAVVTEWSAEAGAYTDYAACKLKAANGETLADEARYTSRHTGTTAGGDALYITAVGASRAVVYSGFAGTTAEGTLSFDNGSPGDVLTLTRDGWYLFWFHVSLSYTPVDGTDVVDVQLIDATHGGATLAQAQMGGGVTGSLEVQHATIGFLILVDNVPMEVGWTLDFTPTPTDPFLVSAEVVFFRIGGSTGDPSEPDITYPG